jgi:hypothetical protein
MSITETLLQKFLSLEKKVDVIDKDVKFVRKNLFGNGMPGLDEQVRLNTRFREDVRKLVFAFAGVFIGQVVLAIITFVKLSG